MSKTFNALWQQNCKLVCVTPVLGNWNFPPKSPRAWYQKSATQINTNSLVTVCWLVSQCVVTQIGQCTVGHSKRSIMHVLVIGKQCDSDLTFELMLLNSLLLNIVICQWPPDCLVVCLYGIGKWLLVMHWHITIVCSRHRPKISLIFATPYAASILWEKNRFFAL